MDKNEFENGAHASMLSFLIGKKDVQDMFKEETGLDVRSLVNRSPIEAMVDEATGFEQDVMCRWIIFATENFWGEAEESENIEVYMRAKEYLKVK